MKYNIIFLILDTLGILELSMYPSTFLRSYMKDIVNIKYYKSFYKNFIFFTPVLETLIMLYLHPPSKPPLKLSLLNLKP